jgi:small subunit ribosomal protein S19
MVKRKKAEAPRRKEEFTYKGYTVDKLRGMELGEVVTLLPARQRRAFKRGLTEDKKRLLQQIKEGKQVRTHLRDLIILPEMVGNSIAVHDGKTFNQFEVMPEMIGHYLGEYALTRKRVTHGGPGVGATRSSKYVPLK